MQGRRSSGEGPASPKRPRTEEAGADAAPAACASEVYMAVATAGSRVGVAWYDAAVGEVRPACRRRRSRREAGGRRGR